MITFAFIIIYPVITLVVGYLIGSWKKEEEPIIARGAPLSFPDNKPQEEIIQKKKDLGVVSRPSAEDLERRARPRLVQEEEAWDNDMEKLFKTPYKMGVSQ